MSKLKYDGIPVEINNMEYNLLFTVNVIDELEEHFEDDITSLKNWMLDGKKVRYKNLAYILYVLVKECIEIRKEDGKEAQDITLEKVRRHINTVNVGDYMLAITEAYIGSFLRTEEDEDPNK